jgi:mediator of RNA polymerase II transcription subunit 12
MTALTSPQPSVWPVRLITEIPLSGLSDQVRNLRSTLLRGTTYSADLEERALNSAKRGIAAAIPALFGLGSTASKLGDVKLTHLGPTVQLELGIWLRQQVAQYAEVDEQ